MLDASLRAEVVQRLADEPLFAGQVPESLADLASSGSFRTLKARGYLWRQGDLPDGLALVWEGKLRITRGKGMTYRHISSGLVGHSGAIGGTPCSADVIAVTDTAVFVIPRERVERYALTHPIVAIRAVRHLANLVAVLSNELDDERNSYAWMRILNRLRYKAGGGSSVRTTQAELALETGLGAAAVSKAMGYLRRHGHVAYDERPPPRGTPWIIELLGHSR
jgi:CRP-like cAMP-binding protein